jgi:hypothetical protein
VFIVTILVGESLVISLYCSCQTLQHVSSGEVNGTLRYKGACSHVPTAHRTTFAQSSAEPASKEHVGCDACHRQSPWQRGGWEGGLSIFLIDREPHVDDVEVRDGLQHMKRQESLQGK